MPGRPVMPVRPKLRPGEPVDIRELKKAARDLLPEHPYRYIIELQPDVLPRWQWDERAEILFPLLLWARKRDFR